MEGVYGDLCSLVYPKTQHFVSAKEAFLVYLQQLQQVISSGGGPQLLTQGCVYAYRAASQMGGTFPPSVTWTEGESETARSKRLFMIFWIIKKLVGGLLTL